MKTSGQRLSIKKYANRRFYDTTRSRHVTLTDLHDAIVAGDEIQVSDSKTGDDITHQVLMQILLERDPPKLTILPTNILHQVIRTQQQFLGTVMDQFLRQILDAQRASHERWTSFMRNVMGMPGEQTPASPLQWTRAMMDAWRPPHEDAPDSAAPAAGPEKSAPAPAAQPQSQPLDDLRAMRAQLASLQEQITALAPESSPSAERAAGAAARKARRKPK